MRTWRFANAAPRYDVEDENKFRRAMETALQQVSVPAAGTGGTGTLEVDNAGAVISNGVNDLNFSTDFSVTVTQSTPTVIVGVSLATTQPAAHTWSALQTMPGGIAGPLTMSGGAITVNPGPLVVGADPTGAEPLRVGGSARLGVSGSYSNLVFGTTGVAILTAGLSTDKSFYFSADNHQWRNTAASVAYMTLTSAALYPQTALTLGLVGNPWAQVLIGSTAITSQGSAPRLVVRADHATQDAIQIQDGNGTAFDTWTIGLGTGDASNSLAFYDVTVAVQRLKITNAGIVIIAPGGANASVSASAIVRVGGEIACATAADVSPFTQARISAYRDSTNWGYIGYGNDAVMRIVYSATSQAHALSIGTSSAVDNTGTYVETMRVAPTLVTIGIDPGAGAGASGTQLRLVGSITNKGRNTNVSDGTLSAGFWSGAADFTSQGFFGSLTGLATGASDVGIFQNAAGTTAWCIVAQQSGDVGLGKNYSGGLGATQGVIDGTWTRFGGTGNTQTYDVLSFDPLVNKWRPRFLQTSVSTGVLTAGANGDGTFSVFAFDGRALSGTSIAGPTPTVTAVYGGFIVDMGTTPPANFAWDIEWTNSANGNTGGPVRVTSQRMVFQFFSANSAVPFGTTATTFQFKVSQTGGTAAVYGTLSAALAPSLSTEVNAFGLIVASQIACVNLAAISADLGVAAAGVLADAVKPANQTRGIFIKATAFEDGGGSTSTSIGNWTRGIILADSITIPAGLTKGIFFGSANPMPGPVAYGLDFTATGSNLFLKTPNFTVDGNGNVVVNGVLSVQAGTSTTFSRVSGSLLSVGGYTAVQTPNGTLTATIASLAVGANAWNAAGRGIRFIICGRIQAQTSGGDTIKIRLCYGGTTAAFNLFTSGSMTNSLTAQAFMLTGSIGVTNGAGAWGQCTAIQSLGNVNATSVITGLNNTIGGSTSNGITAATLFLVWDATGSGGASDSMMVDSAIIEYVGA